MKPTPLILALASLAPVLTIHLQTPQHNHTTHIGTPAHNLTCALLTKTLDRTTQDLQTAHNPLLRKLLAQEIATTKTELDALACHDRPLLAIRSGGVNHTRGGNGHNDTATVSAQQQKQQQAKIQAADCAKVVAALEMAEEMAEGSEEALAREGPKIRDFVTKLAQLDCKGKRDGGGFAAQEGKREGGL